MSDGKSKELTTVFVPSSLVNSDRSGLLIGKNFEDKIFVEKVIFESSQVEGENVVGRVDHGQIRIDGVHQSSISLLTFNQIPSIDPRQFVENFNQSSTSQVRDSPLYVVEPEMVVCGVELTKCNTVKALWYRCAVLSFILSQTSGKTKIKMARVNQLFLLVIDVLLGVAVWRTLSPSAERICAAEHQNAVRHLARRFGDGLLWLASNPGGLKLNPKLAHFLSQFGTDKNAVS
jgi:hypothetical protein